MQLSWGLMMPTLLTSGEAEVPHYPAPVLPSVGEYLTLLLLAVRSQTPDSSSNGQYFHSFVHTPTQPKSDCPFPLKALPSPCCFMDSLYSMSFSLYFSKKSLSSPPDTDKTPVLSMASLTLNPHVHFPGFP